VWTQRPRDDGGSGPTIFADTAQGVAMEQRLSAAESSHPARVCGRLEFGEEASRVILDILEREPFDLVVMGREGDGRRQEPGGGHVAASVAKTARCRVVTLVHGAAPTPADGS
jgi:nucleotide-binding universal stress UspA family protein